MNMPLPRLLVVACLCGGALSGVHAQNTWLAQPDAGTSGRAFGVGFTIGSAGYTGLGGTAAGSGLVDFWQYSGGVWTQMADFEGGPTVAATGFAVGSKGYVVGGYDNSDAVNNHVWEYDPVLNDWFSKNDFPGTARSLAAAFVVGSKAYYGTGADDNGVRLNDFWSYDPSIDTWVQRANFGGGARNAAAAFTIESSGYIATGVGASGSSTRDLWKYDPVANTWAQKTDLPGVARAGATAFGSGSTGYVGTGLASGFLTDLWQYYPHHDQWVQRQNFPGSGRIGAISFVTGASGYVGTGYDGAEKKDFYKYIPEPLSISAVFSGSVCAGASGTAGYGSVGLTFHPGNTFTVQLSDASGNFASAVGIGSVVSTASGGVINYTIPVNTPAGSGYRMRVVSTDHAATGADNGVDISIAAAGTNTVSIAASPGSSVCAGTTVTFSATSTSVSTPHYQWKKNGVDVGTDNSAYVSNSLTTGDVIEVVMTATPTCTSPAVVTSNSINMTVNPILPASVGIAVSPGAELCNTTAATFTATPVNGGASPLFQWKRNNLNVGTNSATYSPTDLVDGDVIKCFMTSNGVCATPVNSESNSVAVIVSGIVTPSVSIDGPGPFCSGTAVTLTAVPIHGGASPSFVWKKNGQVVGSNSPAYSDATFAHNDQVTVEMTTSRTCVTSATATGSFDLNVIPSVAPDITVSSWPGTEVPANTRVVFNAIVTAGGETPLFEWKVNGVPLGTTSKLAIDQPTDGTEVTCTLTSSAGCTSSSTVTSPVVKISVDPSVTRDGHSWERRNAIPGSVPVTKLNAASFVVNGRYYVTTGKNEAGADTRETWEYNPATGVWTQKSDFAGGVRHGAVGFTIGTKGYIATGMTSSGSVYKKDLWEYDPQSNNWLRRADLTGASRTGAIVFVVGTKAYLGTGHTGAMEVDDFWVFDQGTNSWSPVASFPGSARHLAAAFTVGTNGYVVGGVSGAALEKDVWQYSTSLNQWISKADFPGGARRDHIGFASGGYGFAGGGSAAMNMPAAAYRTDFWRYDDVADSWTREHDFFGNGVSPDRPTAAVYNGRAFVYTGTELWEFNTLTLESIKNKSCQGEQLMIPFNAKGLGAGAGNTYTVQVSLAQNFSTLTNIGSITSAGSGESIPVTVPLSLSGNLYLRVVSTNPAAVSPLERLQVSPVNRTLTISAQPNNVCQGTPITFRSSLGAGHGTFQWVKNTTNVGTDSPEYVDNTLEGTDVVRCVLTYVDVCSNPLSITSNSLSVAIKTAPKPVISISGNTLSTTLAVGYQWYDADGLISGATGQTYVISEDGIYKVRIASTNGCTNDSDPFTAVFTSIDAAYRNGVRFYPNPFVHEFEIDASELDVAADVSIFSELGQKVYSRSMRNSTTRVDLKQFPAGVYFLKIDDGVSVEVKRIVKLR